MNLTLALILIPLAVAAWAAFPSCVSKGQDGYEEPATLRALLDCQGKAQEYYRSRGGAKRDRFDDFQKSEVRQYLARHPDRADAGAAPAEDSGKPHADRQAQADEPAKASPDAAEQKERALKAAKANASRLEEGRQAGYEGLNKKLWEMSDDGRAGVTPAMAEEIVKRLQDQQGGVSVEMRSLLDALQKDGGKLSDGSMLKLKGAARDAKAGGLDLGVGADVEKWLLDPETDPKATEAQPSLD
ncbi:MAG: hypothetical protein HY748_18000 [Elusimicrobia bacterium]|nr:hypothetical protein [Elusimicrobiota bacterium]